MNNTLRYDYITKKMRQFFRDEKGFVEVPASTRLSILAACEDPTTITLFNMGGQSWPLPQTGQNWHSYGDRYFLCHDYHPNKVD